MVGQEDRNAPSPLDILQAENARLREELSDREDDIRTEQLWVTHWKEELDCTKDILEQTRTQLATVTNKFEMSEAIVAGDGALITGLKNDLAAAQIDAKRYRWLREHPGYMGWEHDFRADEIDAAIDAEMKGEQPEQEK